jgi:hypothetical protein
MRGPKIHVISAFVLASVKAFMILEVRVILRRTHRQSTTIWPVNFAYVACKEVRIGFDKSFLETSALYGQ